MMPGGGGNAWSVGTAITVVRSVDIAVKESQTSLLGPELSRNKNVSVQTVDVGIIKTFLPRLQPSFNSI